MDKFKYAPGLPGFGTQGADGLTGAAGNSIYFTDLDLETDSVVVKNRITGNIVLWSSQSGVLTNGKIYADGDIIVDKNGKVWEILLSAPNKYYDSGTVLNTSELFKKTEQLAGGIGFTRYSNDFDTGRYIIDNILSTDVPDYTLYPENRIYGIDPENFARIEYSDMQLNYERFNPFTLFSGAATLDNSDNYSIAIVRDVCSNDFRIGNLDDNYNSRGVGIIFDVNRLLVSKDSGNEFNSDTQDGAVLTNHEIAINNLVDPIFVRNPSTWRFIKGPTDVSIYWYLPDFIGSSDTDVLNTIKADLYFYGHFPNLSTVRADSSIVRPMIFNNLDVSGYMKITGINFVDASYYAYISINQNGWSRTSTEIKIQGTGQLDVSAVGLASTLVTSASTYKIDISTNVGWTASRTSGTFYTLSPGSGGITLGPWGVPDVSVIVNANTDPASRSGIITISTGGATVDKIINITQAGVPPAPSISVSPTEARFDGNGGTYYGYTNYTVVTSGSHSWSAKFSSSGTVYSTYFDLSNYSGSTAASVTASCRGKNETYSPYYDTVIFYLDEHPSVTATFYLTQYWL